MADRIDPARRSFNMSRVRSANTRPELEVRTLLHRLGYRFRLHRRSLPGTPDLVFPSRRAVIFIHGCFWHRHAGCPKASMPTTRPEFWAKKFEANQTRDKRVRHALADDGWRVEVVWECEVRDREKLAARLVTFLGAPTPHAARAQIAGEAQLLRVCRRAPADSYSGCAYGQANQGDGRQLETRRPAPLADCRRSLQRVGGRNRCAQAPPLPSRSRRR